MRAERSSRTPRTSCARRSRRSAASSSWHRSTTPTRRRATGSWPRCASRSTGSPSSQPTCSTCRASTPAAVAVAREEVDLAAIAEDCAREVRGVASRRGSEVRTVLGDGDVHARRRRRPCPPGAACPARQRAAPHPGGLADRRDRRGARRHGAARGVRQRPGNRGGRSGAPVRALLPRTERRPAGQRPRSGDRATSSPGAWAGGSRWSRSPAIPASPSCFHWQARRVRGWRGLAFRSPRSSRPSVSACSSRS